MRRVDILSSKVERSLSNHQLAEYICQQINHFFPDPYPVQKDEVLKAIELSEERVFYCFGNIRKKYFNEVETIHFNHLISDQYCMYLYMLANHYHLSTGEIQLPTKLYLLNKALHSVDIYFTTQLPEIFLLVHPLGTIIGRAQFSDYFIAYQGCTVGCLNDGIFPTFEGKTILYANTSVLGNCKIGDNVCFAAGTMIVNKTIEANKIVMGQSPQIITRPNLKDIEQRPPFVYGK